MVIAVLAHVAVHIGALPIKRSVVHASPSSHVTGHDATGSQVSPGSTRPSPQRAMHSPSVALVHPLGQQPSPERHVVIAAFVHVALQVAALPASMSAVQAFPSLQLVGHDDGGSQVSPGSTVPSPQLAEQSMSPGRAQPAGQQPSPPRHVVIATLAQSALQVLALPTSMSVVHASPSLQLAGHDDGGSHVSPGSSVPSPQLAEQSESLALVQPLGQHPSPAAHAEIGVLSQRALQLDGEPVSRSLVQATPSSHDDGHDDAGSQVSPGSIVPFPQPGGGMPPSPLGTPASTRMSRSGGPTSRTVPTQAGPTPPHASARRSKGRRDHAIRDIARTEHQESCQATSSKRRRRHGALRRSRERSGLEKRHPIRTRTGGSRRSGRRSRPDSSGAARRAARDGDRSRRPRAR
jgi:hypothetical protein